MNFRPVALEDVRHADETRDELRRRVLVDLGRRADLLDPSLVEDRETVAHRQRLFLVVRDVHERDPDLADLPLDSLELDLHLLPELQVERPERLVEEEHARRIHERACERDPLALPSGELDRLAIRYVGQSDDVEDLPNPPLALCTRDALYAQAIGDVVRDRHVREQRVVLEHRVDVPLVRRAIRDVGAVELHLACVGALEARDDPERRRLPGARRAEKREELSAPDLEIDVIDGDHVAVRLAHADEPYVHRSRDCWRDG